jgi:hypothetical protein
LTLIGALITDASIRDTDSQVNPVREEPEVTGRWRVALWLAAVLLAALALAACGDDDDDGGSGGGSGGGAVARSRPTLICIPRAS